MKNCNSSLESLLFAHDNDYGVSPSQMLSSRPSSLPSLSIVIPYYETGPVFSATLKHLYNSINTVQASYSSWQCEVIVVDDGSTSIPASQLSNPKIYPSLQIITLPKNQGRTKARNAGLFKAKFDKCLFIDSDVLLDSQLIMNHLLAHSYIRESKHSSAITVSFFEFTDQQTYLLNYDSIFPADLKLNDYRLHCLYGPTWIGCESDKEFIGQEFNIVHDTNYFRNWKGFYAAWALTNMVLGGCFMVDRTDSISAKGFNESFSGYGFTETSLPTKLICGFHHFLVPILIGGGAHIEDKIINVSRSQKDEIFWKKHDFYFNHYLKLTLSEAVYEKTS